MKLCYNCGIELTKDNRTKEHIPAQNTFIGYPPEYKFNRLTVHACFNCNNEFSKIDKEIRDAIGIMNDNDEKQAELTRKAVEAIMKEKNWPERLEYINGRVDSVSFSYDTFKALHIKNFKGIFYDKFGYPLSDDFKIEIIAEGDFDDFKLSNIAQYFTDYVSDGGDFQQSGHSEIFQYKLKTLTPVEGESRVDNAPNMDNALGVVAVLVYHKKLKAVIIAAKKDFLESIHKEKNIEK